MAITRRDVLHGLMSCVAYPAVAQTAPESLRTPARGAAGPLIRISSPSLAIDVTQDGRIVACMIGPDEAAINFHASTMLADCQQDGEMKSRPLVSGGVEFSRLWVDTKNGRRCAVTERLFPTPSSIRWEVEVLGSAGAWTTPIETRAGWADTASAKFWTAWDSPAHDGADWADPLVPRQFADMDLRYGGYLDEKGAFSVPIATILDGRSGRALSLVQSPESDLLNMRLRTTSKGDVSLVRLDHRISAKTPVRFALDLVGHPADWRGGLGWMVNRYPAYFNPPNTRVYELDGCGSYTRYQGELDESTLRKIGYSVNWNAHFDFPFLGMSIPPVAPDVEWSSWYQEETSLGRMRLYDQRMKRAGFHVLEYFVITECGNKIEEEPPPRKAKDDKELWRDGNDFVHYQIPSAVIRDKDGKIQFSNWFGNVVVDPAEPSWQANLLRQISTLVKELPESDGICVDRMDWLTLYNRYRDDGLSWVDEHPARSLVVSWKETIAKIAQAVHEADKVVYANPLVKRIDAMRFIDGIYDEYGDYPHVLNLSAFLSVLKPAIAWARSIDTIRPDPDAYFQRLLHLGIFPTAPLPGSDHTIGADPWVMQQYLDYGSLLVEMKGKSWLLEPGVVSVSGNVASVNIFKVPRGYLIPITFAKNESSVPLTIQGLPRNGQRLKRSVVFHPGASAPAVIDGTRSRGSELQFNVPIHRGCALLLLECEESASPGDTP